MSGQLERARAGKQAPVRESGKGALPLTAAMLASTPGRKQNIDSTEGLKGKTKVVGCQRLEIFAWEEGLSNKKIEMSYCDDHETILSSTPDASGPYLSTTS